MAQNSSAKRIDELKARKKELLARRKSIIADMDAGTLQDKFPLFFCNEEIRSVNAQLRASAHRKTTATKTLSDGKFAVERRLYSDWLHQDENEAIDEYHTEMKNAARDAAKMLTSKQLFYFARWADGIPVSDIALASGVDRSTVSRTISRAKKRIRDEFALRNATPSGKHKRIDLCDGDVLRLILSLLTPYQAVCLYLYYGEWLSLRDCASLLSVDHSTVYRTIQRGLTSICKALDCQHISVENIDIIGDLAYETYVEHAESIGDIDVLPKAEWKERIESGEKRKKCARKKEEKSAEELKYAISVVNGNGERCNGMRKESQELRTPGKLLSLLIKSKKLGQIKAVLFNVFKNLCGRKQRNERYVYNH